MELNAMEVLKKNEGNLEEYYNFVYNTPFYLLQWILMTDITRYIFVFTVIVLGWVVFPLVLINVVSFQHFVIFLNMQDPINPQFDNPEKYNFQGVVNFYITTEDVNSSSTLTIGSWLLVPHSQINSTNIDIHNNETVSKILSTSTYPILLYMHGVGCNRIKPKETYAVLRKKFMIISVDNRGYGDSGLGLYPSEVGIASDTAQIFKWIRKHTNNDIYMWGHSLGTALITRAVRKLKEENIVPTGLVLENPFTTIREEITTTRLGQFYTWMPYVVDAVVNSLEANGLEFKTSENILGVDCPIMILHAKDDDVVPYILTNKLVEIASTQRKIPPQGNITYHLFESLGYGHTGVTLDPSTPSLIDKFMGYCKEQNKRRG